MTQYETIHEILDLNSFHRITASDKMTKEHYASVLGIWIFARCKEYNDKLLLPKESLPSRT